MEKDVTLNDEKMTEDEFLEQKKMLENKKGVKIVKISEDKFKTRIQG